MKVTFFSGVALAAIAAERTNASSPVETVAAEIEGNKLAEMGESSPVELLQTSVETQEDSTGLAEIDSASEGELDAWSSVDSESESQSEAESGSESESEIDSESGSELESDSDDGDLALAQVDAEAETEVDAIKRRRAFRKKRNMKAKRVNRVAIRSSKKS
mmetsp:Transcript_30917/g.38217  ORF Transcript_30917/g.38217 Transcript_30917/m.38217 type:complete len:161 (-) Transcript_30917:1918-2400(-)